MVSHSSKREFQAPAFTCKHARISKFGPKQPPSTKTKKDALFNAQLYLSVLPFPRPPLSIQFYIQLTVVCSVDTLKCGLCVARRVFRRSLFHPSPQPLDRCIDGLFSDPNFTQDKKLSGVGIPKTKKQHNANQERG